MADLWENFGGRRGEGGSEMVDFSSTGRLRAELLIANGERNLENLRHASAALRYGSTITRRLRQETSTMHKESDREGLKRKAETMYKYKFRFRGVGKRVENMNFKFHCFIADTEAVEHHLFEAKNKGLVVADAERQPSSTKFDDKVYVSAMPIVKVFSSTNGFGIPKEYFSFFFLLNQGSKKMVKIKPLGFDNKAAKDSIADWYFLAPGRFLTKDEIRGFFGSTGDTWKFYQRQSFLSKRRLLDMIEVGENKHTYNGEVETNEDRVRMVRLD